MLIVAGWGLESQPDTITEPCASARSATVPTVRTMDNVALQGKLAVRRTCAVATTFHNYWLSITPTRAQLGTEVLEFSLTNWNPSISKETTHAREDVEVVDAVKRLRDWSGSVWQHINTRVELWSVGGIGSLPRLHVTQCRRTDRWWYAEVVVQIGGGEGSGMEKAGGRQADDIRRHF